MPLNIAVLTISDIPARLADDQVRTTLSSASPPPVTSSRRGDRHRRRRGDPRIIEMDRRSRRRCHHHHPADRRSPAADVTPEAIEPLFEKRMDGFSIAFHMLSHAKDRRLDIQSRATAGVAGATVIFCLPGSPGACRDGWDGHPRRPTRLPHAALPILSRSCRGSMSICDGRKQKAHRPECRPRLRQVLSQATMIRPAQ